MSGAMHRRRFAGALAGLAAASFANESVARARSSPEQRLSALGLTLPPAPAPVATYAPYRRSGRTLYLSGIGPAAGGESFSGRLGAELSVEQGYAAARATGINVLSQLRGACGSLDRVRRCLHVGVFVASADDFHDQPRVANGATDLFVEIFGEAGLGARFAIGVNTLPFNIPVEIESVWELR